MAVTEQQPDLDSQDDFNSAEAYSQLQTESNLSSESFAANADDIFATIRTAVEQGLPRKEGYRKATEIYVNDETDPALKTQAMILLSAHLAAGVSRELERVNQELKRNPNQELRNQRRGLVEEILQYNHLLRDFVHQNSSKLSRPQLENWLEKASGGDTQWSKAEVAGFSGEVAAANLLATIPGIKAVQLSEIDQDRRGIDMLVKTINGREVPIDIKTGGQVGFETVEAGGRVEIGLKREEIDGFSIHPDYRSEVIARARAAIFG